MEIIKASDIEPADTSYFLPWRLEMIYSIEPGLAMIAKKAKSQKGRRFETRLDAYGEAKLSASPLLGWGARDPRLRSSDAWDCFFDDILEALNM